MTILEAPPVVDTEIAEFINVTPDLAQRWLGVNTANRKLKAANVTAFARDMVEGRWRTNGEAIKLAGPPFAPTKLLDGQNRLHAVLKAGIPVRMLIVFGVDEDAQGTMDSGAKRTVADNLTIHGVKNAHVVASGASLAIRIAMGRPSGGTLGVTNAAVEEWIADNPDIIRSAHVAVQYANRADAPASVVAFTHFTLSRLDLGEATAFWRDAAEKIGLSHGDPVNALTHRLAQARRQREKINPGTLVAAVFRAWNYRRQGKPLSKMQFSQNADGSITIPRPI
jgi:hypothetical protein